MNAPDGYYSRFDPNIEYEIWLRCHLDLLSLRMATKLRKNIRIYRISLWQQSIQPFIGVLQTNGISSMPQKKEFNVAVMPDHEYFNVHVENTLKKAYEHIAQLHGNTKAEVEGFDLFA